MAGKFPVSHKEKHLVTVLVMVVFVYALYQYGYIPLRDQAENIDAKIVLAQKRLEKDLKISQEPKLLDEQYKSVLSKYEQTTSDQEVMTRILSDIETVGHDINISLADLKPSKAKKIDFYNQFMVSLALEGQLMDIMFFIETLQRAPYNFYVNDFQLRKISTQAEKLSCQITFSRIFIPN